MPGITVTQMLEKAPGALTAGDVVALVDGRGRFLAKAFWSARSKIALRIVTLDKRLVELDRPVLEPRRGYVLDFPRCERPKRSNWHRRWRASARTS